MRAHNFDGIPYLDMKTYQGWKSSGFQVKRGEKSVVSGITWVGVGTRSEDPKEAERAEAGGDKGFVFPKEYHLFHRSQVEAI